MFSFKHIPTPSDEMLRSVAACCGAAALLVGAAVFITPPPGASYELSASTWLLVEQGVENVGGGGLWPTEPSPQTCTRDRVQCLGHDYDTRGYDRDGEICDPYGGNPDCLQARDVDSIPIGAFSVHPPDSTAGMSKVQKIFYREYPTGGLFVGKLGIVSEPSDAVCTELFNIPVGGEYPGYCRDTSDPCTSGWSPTPIPLYYVDSYYGPACSERPFNEFDKNNWGWLFIEPQTYGTVPEVPAGEPLVIEWACNQVQSAWPPAGISGGHKDTYFATHSLGGGFSTGGEFLGNTTVYPSEDTTYTFSCGELGVFQDRYYPNGRGPSSWTLSIPVKVTDDGPPESVTPALSIAARRTSGDSTLGSNPAQSDTAGTPFPSVLLPFENTGTTIEWAASGVVPGSCRVWWSNDTSASARGQNIFYTADASSGQPTGTLAENRVYTLTCTADTEHGDGSWQTSVVVKRGGVGAPECEIFASAAAVKPEEPFSLSWYTYGEADFWQLKRDNTTLDDVPQEAQGEYKTNAPATEATYTYTLRVYNPEGDSNPCTRDVVVDKNAGPDPDPGVISSFIATPPRVRSGNITQLSWQTANMESCRVYSSAHATYEVPAGELNSGSVARVITKSTTFTLSCVDGLSDVHTKSALVNLLPWYIEI